MSDRLLFSDLSEINNELRRLGTFDTWPNDSQAWPSALACAGFYYEGNDDETRCFRCGCVIRNWQGRRDPFEEHKKVNPHCPHLMREGTQSSSPADQPQSVSTYSTRPSFDSGDCTVDFIAHPAGDYDSNTSNNRNCDLPVRVTDRPSSHMVNEAERLKTFSNWPRNHPARPEELARNGLYFVGPADRVRCAFCQNFLLKWEEGDIPMVEHMRLFPNCPFVQGIDVGNISTDQNDMFTSNTSLYTQLRHQNNQSSTRSLGSSEESIDGLGVSSRLDAKKKEPKQQKTCTVCLNEDATIVFLPCEHTCCCLDCSREIDQCPVCREDIIATVSVFFP